MSFFYTFFKSPLGDLLLLSDGENLTGLYPPEHAKYRVMQKGEQRASVFQHPLQELDHYFSGKIKHFSSKLKISGTPFQTQVWQMLREIPFGEIWNYQQIAEKINNPKACRAVGLANRENPISLIIPCHRVCGKDGKMRGYAGGNAAKEWLLNHERVYSI